MKNLLIVLFSTVLIACQESSSLDKNTMLTNTTWEHQQYLLFNGEMSDYHCPIRFMKDGTYRSGDSENALTGTWTWQDENKIQLTLSGIEGDGEFAAFPHPVVMQLTVKKLTRTEFQYVSQGEGPFLSRAAEVNLITVN